MSGFLPEFLYPINHIGQIKEEGGRTMKKLFLLLH